ncbi:hypothetical protein HF086_009595 [Spodoptera exigua]|uniref:GPN-loop GTPase n=1 Tax=Spodoptera exigua TaxID=7107 RepID=A0A922M3L5_SPOEX|nr:hypothetical protein HF086_009595 [Spodoptera exigua]
MATSQPKPEAMEEDSKKPICLIILGMAGAGKTSFTRRLAGKVVDGSRPYLINLDPACREVPYPANIDIRDTVNYKEVMKQYGLGPNGGIVTALNLFSTKFGQVVDLIEKAGKKHKYCIIDTPGQIEVFTWSASGTIVTEALASSCPTVVVYVMDTVRSVSPVTFMSNMLYACSILYKTRLPFIVVMNKGLDEFFKLVDDAAEEYERDYKADWLKMRAEKLEEEKRKAEELKNKGPDDTVIDKKKLIEEVSGGREISDMYLKHPANESSNDKPADVAMFNDFIRKHVKPNNTGNDT